MYVNPVLKLYYLEQLKFESPLQVELRVQKQNNKILNRLKVSEKEYWAKYYEHPDLNYEWKNGYLEEKFVGNVRNILVASWLDFVIKCYLFTNPIAKIIQLEFGFRMSLSDGVSIRKPDFALVLNDNPVPLKYDDRSYRGIFDLCIESISDSNSKAINRDTIDKKNEYSEAGVKEYYILDENGENMSFYRLNETGIYLKIKPVDGDIIKSKVLPGLQFRISDLKKKPSIEQMANDEIYQDFVTPYYKKERLRAEREKKRAEDAELRIEKEKQVAEQERLRAEKERLRAEKEKQRAEQAINNLEKEKLRVKMLEEKISHLEKNKIKKSV